MDKQDKLIDFETLCEGHKTSMGRSRCPYHGKISRCLHPDNKAIDGWHAPSIRIEECPIWNGMEAIPDKAYFVSFEEYMQHQHEMIEDRLQRLAKQMTDEIKTAPHYPTEGTFWERSGEDE